GLAGLGVDGRVARGPGESRDARQGEVLGERAGVRQGDGVHHPGEVVGREVGGPRGDLGTRQRRGVDAEVLDDAAELYGPPRVDGRAADEGRGGGDVTRAEGDRVVGADEDAVLVEAHGARGGGVAALDGHGDVGPGL